MKNTSRLLDNLRDKGERITDVRKAIIEILSAAPRPLSVQDLLSALKKKQLAVNKTTVYRQLEQLLFHNIVREIRFQDRSARYEVSLGDDHHHHLVCTKCHKTEDISFEEDLERQEKVIMHKKKFKVLQHSLEFFGLCASCQKK
ncbi:MAG: hypothetical protein A3I29_04920 [Candidatus Magasanikbacteria bacterium RIFCSPLOWO2_02_FULL_44_11]|uniref:Transcriptional repressor n=2 Tax=Candidatus Magasanikiibacteriota TaxID=1752731 RepID=A0A1F6NAI0_9BACT|nr:MAG: hypothetical protein A3D53_02340 [Candidatus Magasanikbacteria bacterium RIFCSPHIGHO2_02_FULL_45_10]OGH80798.1 MAG: hypothetical protein A3I29_04920 [Candidatus Magasanikbacteria bacterium RIFCSPLOWO2_02_FULL_44_11]